MQLSSNFNYLGGLQKPGFAKVPKTLVKHHFWSQIAVLPKRHKCAALAANFSPEALQIMCFTRFQLLGPQSGHTKAQLSKPSSAQRKDKLHDRNLDVQILQKLRCTLCSLSTKRSLPQRSGRSPLEMNMIWITMNMPINKRTPMKITGHCTKNKASHYDC